MKLVLAIVGNDDSDMVSSALTNGGFFVTKLAATGGFLKSGNTTFIIGTDDDKVDKVISIISQQSHRRTQFIPSAATMDTGISPSIPINSTVGGSTIFVLNIDRFKKV